MITLIGVIARAILAVSGEKMQSAFREAQKISRHLLFMDHLANDGFAGTDQSDKTVSEELFIGSAENLVDKIVEIYRQMFFQNMMYKRVTLES